MRILLDENLDWRMGRGLRGHEVESVHRLGWAGIQNGVLLARCVIAERGRRKRPLGSDLNNQRLG